MADSKVLAIIALLALALALAIFKGKSYYTQQPADKGDIVVYGSKTCPWCVKQESYLTEKGIPYTFVDCKAGKCPEFVQGFPTLSINGDIKSGYTEL